MGKYKKLSCIEGHLGVIQINCQNGSIVLQAQAIKLCKIAIILLQTLQKAISVEPRKVLLGHTGAFIQSVAKRFCKEKISEKVCELCQLPFLRSKDWLKSRKSLKY